MICQLTSNSTSASTTDCSRRGCFSITTHPIVPWFSVGMIRIRSPSKPGHFLDIFLSEVFDFWRPKGPPRLDFVVLIVDSALRLYGWRQGGHIDHMKLLLRECLQQLESLSRKMLVCLTVRLTCQSMKCVGIITKQRRSKHRGGSPFL